MLTAKGTLTRARIVEATARLVALKGADGTCLDDIRAATGTSKSQLFHYFPEGKSQLMLAAAEQQAQRVLDDQRPSLDQLTSWDAWARWEQVILRIYSARSDHGSLAALTSQFPRNDPRIREVICSLYQQWHERLVEGLRTMGAGGLLRPEADADGLATAVLVAVHGGVAMGQATGSLDALRTGLKVAIDHIRLYAASPSARENVAEPATSFPDRMSVRRKR
jgi:AcrR family transcriptional regulator